MSRLWPLLRTLIGGFFLILHFIIALPLILYARFAHSRRRLQIGLAVSDDWPDRLQFRRFPYDLAIARTGANILTFAPHHLPQLDAMLNTVDGLVFSGGEDIGAEHYKGDPNTVGRVNSGRDKLELALLERAAERNIPVLCVCRGAQLLAVSAGGRLESHDHDEELMKSHFTTPYRIAKHSVSITPGSRLYSIMSKEPVVQVNSFHHQAITDPGSLKVTALGDGKVIEGVEMPGERFVVGVQWHPELQAFWSRRQQALFDALIHAAAKRRDSSSQ